MMQPPDPATLAAARAAAPVKPGRGTAGRQQTLKRRAEFLACARAHKAHTHGVVVQGRRRQPGEAEGVRVGFTASRKVGKAVARNRARRRLREAAHRILSEHGRDGWDYVLIARRETTVARPFGKLVKDLEHALARIHDRTGQ